MLILTMSCLLLVVLSLLLRAVEVAVRHVRVAAAAGCDRLTLLRLSSTADRWR